MRRKKEGNDFCNGRTVYTTQWGYLCSKTLWFLYSVLFNWRTPWNYRTPYPISKILIAVPPQIIVPPNFMTYRSTSNNRTTQLYVFTLKLNFKQYIFKTKIVLKSTLYSLFLWLFRITIGFLLNVPPSNKAVAPEFFPPKK